MRIVPVTVLAVLACASSLSAAQPRDARGAGRTDSSIWRVLALRADFPVEEPDEPTTTGNGRFDLRSSSQARPEYRLPFDLPPHDRAYFAAQLQALARYYAVVAGGKVEIEYAVYPAAPEEAYTLPRPLLHYGTGRTEEEIGRRWLELFGDAVALADADPEGPVFSAFDSYLILHAGAGQESGQLNDVLSVFLDEDDFARWARTPVTVDGGTLTLRQGWILPESPGAGGQAGLNGLLAKFFGHQLGLPGLSNFADGLPAVGGWSLMDVGPNRLGFVHANGLLLPVIGFAVPHPMAWEKARLGWIEPLTVWRDTTVSLLAGDRPGELPQAVRVPLDGDEYLLLENRQRRGHTGLPAGVDSSGPYPEDPVWIGLDQVELSQGDTAGVWLAVDEYDAFLPGSGVLVWHVDDSVVAAAGQAGINDDPVHPGIALLEADGYRDIGRAYFERLDQIEGSPQDPFYAGGRTRLGPDTRPDTRTYEDWDSGVVVEVLSPPSDTMQVRVTFPRLAPGWSQSVPAGRRLQAADLDGDGAAELVAESVSGLLALPGQGAPLLEADGAGFLAAARAGAGTAARLFTVRGPRLTAWDGGAATWTADLGWTPADGLVAELGLFPGRLVLAVTGEHTVLLDAATGAVLRDGAAGAAWLLAADLDGDGGGELVGVGADTAWVLTAPGSRRLGAPAGGTLPPAAADLDGDGSAEVILAGRDGSLRVLGGDSLRFALPASDSLAAPPVAGDLDGDGFLEVVLAGARGVRAHRLQGVAPSGFPARLPQYAGLGPVEHPPLLVDLDADGRQEIVLATTAGLFALDDDGRLLPGFPLLTAGPVRAAPVAADVDGDGQIELAALAADHLYVWEPAGLAPPYAAAQADWPQAEQGPDGVRTAGRQRGAPAPDPQVGLLPASRAYCYPNPVEEEGQAHLRFFLNRPAQVRLEVFDAVGERVEQRRMGRAWITPAENEIAWPVDRYPSGLYLCRLEARDERGTAHVVVRMAVSR
ncbi:MAG: FG-GAP-like repeat-containing protein [Candidatus Latescibacterota bacterium]